MINRISKSSFLLMINNKIIVLIIKYDDVDLNDDKWLTMMINNEDD